MEYKQILQNNECFREMMKKLNVNNLPSIEEIQEKNKMITQPILEHIEFLNEGLSGDLTPLSALTDKQPFIAVRTLKKSPLS